MWCPYWRAMTDDEFVSYTKMLMLLDDYNADPSVADARHWNPNRNGTVQ